MGFNSAFKGLTISIQRQHKWQRYVTAAYRSTAIYGLQAGQTRICNRFVSRTQKSTERSVLTRVDGHAYCTTKHVNFAVFLEHRAMDKVQKPSNLWMKQCSLCQRDYNEHGLVRYGSHFVAWPSWPYWSILHSAFPRPSISDIVAQNRSLSYDLSLINTIRF